MGDEPVPATSRFNPGTTTGLLSFAFALVVVQLIVFADAIAGIALADQLRSNAAVIAFATLESLIVALLISTAARYGAGRGAGPEMWIGFGVVPLAQWAIAWTGMVRGSYAPAVMAAVATVGISAAWVIERRRSV